MFNKGRTIALLSLRRQTNVVSLAQSFGGFSNHHQPQQTRNYSQYNPIPDITFKSVEPEQQEHHHHKYIDDKKVPLIVLHGLFGSYLNFSTFAKQYSQKHHTKVYLLNLRNHSEKQNHSSVMNFAVMASDLAHFVNKHHIEEFDLFGFSLGGKTSMSACLGNDFKDHVANRVRKLIIGDISPLPLSDSEWDIPTVMNGLVLLDKELDHMTTRAQADQFLKNHVGNPEVRSFLLSNLKKKDSSSSRSGVFDWKFNLSGLSNNLDEIADFPYKTESIVQELKGMGRENITQLPWAPFEKPTLFMKGELSPLINSKSERTLTTIKTFFPNYELFQFDGCTHWIHAEKYALFFSKMEEFLNASNRE